jgi:hypothetical protein
MDPEAIDPMSLAPIRSGVSPKKSAADVALTWPKGAVTLTTERSIQAAISLE